MDQAVAIMHFMIFDLNLAVLHPGWLWGLLLLPVYGILSRKRGGGESTGASAEPLLPMMEGGMPVRHPQVALLAGAAGQATQPSLRKALYLMVVACLLVSLSEPVLRGEQLPELPPERDIVFIVDTSVSMVLRDYLLEGQRLDRMSLLKGVLDRMVQRLEHDRIGIIVFGDHAYTLVPLSRDHALLRTQLQRISVTMAGRFSSVGEAIALAVKQVTQQNNARHSPPQEKRRRVLVLLTAASTPTGNINSVAAATLAADAGLPLYAIAVGATSRAAEETDRKAGLIYQPADFVHLGKLAELTGARAFQAGDRAALDQALHEIEQRETNPRQLPPRFVTRPLYLWPLLLGLLLLTGMPYVSSGKVADNA